MLTSSEISSLMRKKKERKFLVNSPSHQAKRAVRIKFSHWLHINLFSYNAYGASFVSALDQIAHKSHLITKFSGIISLLQENTASLCNSLVN